MSTASNQSQHSDRRYDIFIVHAEGDRAWVNGYLKPMLGVDPERIITRKDFDPTGTLVDEFVNSTESSRFMALVLSPAFLADDWAAFGQQLSTFAAVEEGHSRFVVLTLHECELPLQLRYRVSLDCTNWEEWDDQIAKLRGLLEAPAPVLAEMPCPYPGMVPFRAEDARFFFGRDNEVNDLLTRLRHQQLLFVIGSSGSGKSSLVTAGVLPRIDDPNHFPKGTWRVETLRPGSTPCQELARVLGGSADDPVAAIGPLLAATSGGRKLLLIVDQFEELFTQTKERAEQDRFLARLKAIRDDPRCVVMATMRADFYGDLMNSAMWPVDDSQQVKISAPHGEALRAAIVGPAEKSGVFLEDGLVERLLADAADEPGVLPMLQEALALLWTRRKGRLLTRAAYEAMGSDGRSGMAVAMATKADATLAQLPPDQQKIARRIFLRLVQFGEGRPDTRRQLSVDELRIKADDLAVFESVLSNLIENRLLIPSQDEARGRRVDISHEMLIVGWPASQEWAKVRRAAELTRRWLVTEAEEWIRRGRGESGLLDDGQVSEAERWLGGPDAAEVGIDPGVLALVDASREALRSEREAKELQGRRELQQARDIAEERGRRARLLRGGLIGAGVLSTFLFLTAIYALGQRGSAKRNEAGARKSEKVAQDNEARAIANAERARVQERAALAQGLAFQAIPFLIEESRDPQDALGYSLAAVRASRPVEQPAITALSSSVQDNHLAALIPKHTLGVEKFAWSPRGQRIATIDRLGKLRLWDLHGKPVGVGHELGPFARSYGDISRPLAWSGDGGILVVGTGDGRHLLWIKVGAGSKPRRIDFPAPIQSLEWSPDGKSLAVLVERGSPLPPPPPTPDATPNAPLPTPRLQLFDRNGNWVSTALPINGDVEGFAWNPVTSLLTLFGGAGGISINQPGGGLTSMLPGHQSPVVRLLWAPDGEAMVSADRDNNILFWERGTAVGTPVALGNSVVAWAWSPDSQRLAFAAGFSATVPRMWFREDRIMTPDPAVNKQSAQFSQSVLPQTMIQAIDWAPAGRQFATQHNDQFALWTDAGLFVHSQIGRAIHWHPKTGEALTSPLAPAGENSDAKPDPTLRHLNASGREVSSFRGHETVPVRVAWSPDGLLVASAGNPHEEDLRVWDPTEEPMKTLDTRRDSSGMEVGISNVAWQPGGTTLVLSDSGNFQLRDAEGSPLRTFNRTELGAQLGRCRWSPDGRRFLFLPPSFGEPRVRLFDPSGEMVATMPVRAVAWHPVDPILTTIENGKIQIRDRDGRVTREDPSGKTQGFQWSPDGSSLATVSVDSPSTLPVPAAAPLAPGQSRIAAPAPPTIRLSLWSKELSRKVEATTIGYPITRLVWSPDGRTIAATDDATSIWLWDSDGILIHTIGLPPDGIGPLAWSPDGAYLASVTGGATASAFYNPSAAPQRIDALVLMWDRRGQSVPGFVGKGHDKGVFVVDWCPTREGNVLVTAGAGRTIRLWTPKGEVNGSPLRGHEGPVCELRWVSDGHRFATVSTDRTIRIWNLRINKGDVLVQPVMTLAGPENRLPIVPSVQPRTYAAPSMPSPQTADPRIVVEQTPPGYELAWRPDGLSIASVTNDPFARLWTTELEEIYALGKRRLIKEAARRVGKIAPIWDPLSLTDLSHELTAKDPWVRTRAAHLLGRLGSEASPSLTALIGRLDDQDEGVRGTAHWAVARVATAAEAAAIETIARKINEETSWSVRLSAIEGLSTATGERPSSLLSVLATSVRDERLRPYATRILGSSGKPAFVALTPGVSSDDLDLAFGSLRAIDAIARSRPDDDGAGMVTPELILAVEAAANSRDDRVKAAAVAVQISLLGQKSDVVNPLRELLASQDERTRIMSLDLAAQLDDVRKSVVPAVAELMLDDSDSLRIRAHELLADIGESILPQPVGVKAGYVSPRAFRYDLQAKAIESASPDLQPLLIRMLLDQRRAVADAGAMLIGQVGERMKEAIVDTLLPKLKAGDLTLSYNAAAGLATPLSSRIEPLLKSDRVEERRSAVALTAQLGMPLRALTPHLDPLLTDDDPETRMGAALALWKVEGSAPKTLQVFSVGLENTDAKVREIAVRGLASMGRSAQPALEVLTKLAKDDPVPSIREAALAAQTSLRNAPTPPSKSFSP